MESKNFDLEFVKRASKIRLLLMDCDGVLTDGKLYFSAQGEVLKAFNVRDGQGIAEWHRTGNQSGIITGRGSVGILENRARELGVHFLRSAVKDKSEALESILREINLGADETAYIGDDVPDIAVLRKVGFPVMVNDGAEELAEFCLYKTRANGGCGAVREVTDLLLKLER